MILQVSVSKVLFKELYAVYSLERNYGYLPGQLVKYISSKAFEKMKKQKGAFYLESKACEVLRVNQRTLPSKRKGYVRNIYELFYEQKQVL